MPDINQTDLVARLREIIEAFDDDVAEELSQAEAVGERADLWTETDVPVDILRSAKSTIEAQAAEISRLRDALKPFAEVLKGNYSHQHDDLPISAGFGRDDLRFVLSLSDFRRSRTALEANHG